MLGLADLSAFFERVTYMPGWSFTVEDSYEGPRLWITAAVPSRDDPDGVTVLRVESYLPPFTSEVEAARWLTWRLIRIASHEAREWLKVDGRRVADPHL